MGIPGPAAQGRRLDGIAINVGDKEKWRSGTHTAGVSVVNDVEDQVRGSRTRHASLPLGQEQTRALPARPFGAAGASPCHLFVQGRPRSPPSPDFGERNWSA